MEESTLGEKLSILQNPSADTLPSADGWRIPVWDDWDILFEKLYGSHPYFLKYEGLAPYLLSKDNEPPYNGVDSYGFSISIPPPKKFGSIEFLHGNASGIWKRKLYTLFCWS